MDSRMRKTVAQILTVLVTLVLVAGGRAQNGSCVFAGYTSCCISGSCTGGPIEDCFCDDFCRILDDCCQDINVTCSRDLPPGNDTYLLFANRFFIRRVDPDGSNLVTVVDSFSGGAFGIDYHHRLGMMFWSDLVTEEIYQANLDGSGMTELVNTSLELVDDVAVDWINDKLYWTDNVHARIEVADIFDSNMRKVLLRTGGNTRPRAIVVDPRNRYMYWSDWGETAMIERASMDGQARQVIIPDDLIWPNGITIDYAEDKLYWADANLNKIEYSNLDGTNRLLLETQQNGVLHPFSITIENELLYWTDWQTVSISTTHKTNGRDVAVITSNNLLVLPNGIEAVTPNRQPQVDNPCDSHGCSHFCLLSSESVLGYTCACPNGGFLDDDLLTCNFTGATPEPPEGAPGSCVDAGYSSCCTTGFCAGTPPSCFCDFECHIRRDCCSDIFDTCPIDTTGSCVAAGFTGCCSAGGPVTCAGSPAACFCDISCLFLQDCCDDFFGICEVLGVVQNIAVTAPSVDVLTITWDPPADPFVFLIVGYQVTVRTISTVVYNEIVSGRTTQVPNLVRFTPYNISIIVVRALISNGNGTREAATSIAFTEEGTPAIAPSGVTLDRVSGTTMTITWEQLALEQARGFVVGYDISYQPSNNRKRQLQSVRAPGDSSELTITGLDPAVSYSASVSAATVVGVGPVSPPVTSTATCFFQIHFFGADNCDDLNSDSAVNDFIQVVVDRTNSRCQCDLANEQIINFILACNADPNAITFRARVLGNDNANCDDIVDRVEEWVTTADTRLSVQGTELTTNTECPVRIRSFDDSFCDVATSSAGARTARIVAPTVVIVVVLGIAIVIVIAVLLRMYRHKKTTHEVFGDESEVGSINLSEAGAQYKPAGASLKTEKEEIHAFEVGDDNKKVTENEYQPVGGMNFHNPIYSK